MRILAISIDSPEESLRFADKIAGDGRGRPSFFLLSDPGSATIDRYRLRDPAYVNTEDDGIPRPAVFVLDREGIIRWSKIETNYRMRPTNDEIRAALEAIR